MKKLTEALIESLPIIGEDYTVFDQSLPGFAVRVTPAGEKLFIARARSGGRRRKVTLGSFSDTKLAEARTAAKLALDDMRNGKDPTVERAARQKAIEAGGKTIAQLAEEWMRDVVRPKRKPRTADDYRRLIDQRIVPDLGGELVSRLGRDDAIRWHGKMKHIPRRANYALATLKALLNYAEDIGLRAPQSNPCRRIEMYREKARERFLSEPEIGKAAEAIRKAEEDGKIGHHAAAGLRLALFTGARSGEITAARWEHYDRERKVIRLPDSKTNEPRTIHLSEAAIEVLTGIAKVGPYIVAGAKVGQPLKNLSRAWIVARAFEGLDDVRLHDLRHSYASLAVNRGISLPMIGKLLGHKVAATTQRYAHLARDVVAAINDDLGVAMTAAIEKAKPQQKGRVVKFPKRRRAGQSDDGR